MKRLLLPMIAASVLFVGCSQQPETTQNNKGASTQPLSRGQQQFLSHCVTCHQGVGNPPDPNPVILNSSALESEESFIALVRQPRSMMMPAFSAEELSDDDAKAIYSYVMGLKTPQPE